jgi:hypothetical protein
MTPSPALSGSRQDQLLLDAVAHQRHVVLTQQTPDGWRLFKGKFIAGSGATRSLMVKLAPSPSDSDVTLPEPGETLGTTFRVGHKKCMFSTPLEGVHRGGDGVSVTLRWPRDIQQIQRRVYERAQPPRGSVVAVRFWRTDRHGETVRDERDVKYGQLEDISCGGMRVRATEAVQVDVGRAYRCVFTTKTGKPPFVIDALLRHREAADHGRASLGFQFVGLDATEEGREVLARLARVIARLKRGRSQPHR